MFKKILILSFIINVLFLSSFCLCIASSDSSLNEKVDKALGEARELKKQNKYKESLEKYVYVFKNSRNLSGWGGVRLSYVPSEISCLGKKYEPAKKVLQKWRDQNKGKILQGQADFDLIHEFIALNEYILGGEKNTMDGLNKVIEKKFDNEEKSIIMLIWNDLAQKGQFVYLKKHYKNILSQVLREISDYRNLQEFPWADILSSKDYLSFLKERIQKEGLLIYETLIHFKEVELADKLQKRLAESQAVDNLDDKIKAIRNKYL